MLQMQLPTPVQQVHGHLFLVSLSATGPLGGCGGAPLLLGTENFRIELRGQLITVSSLPCCLQWDWAPHLLCFERNSCESTRPLSLQQLIHIAVHSQGYFIYLGSTPNPVIQLSFRGCLV